MKISRSVNCYQAKPKNDTEVINRLNDLATKHPGYGFWKMQGSIRLEGKIWNHKKVYRIYTALKMNLRRRHKRRLPTRIRIPHSIPEVMNTTWSLDFMSDALYSGRRIKILNIIDDHNRQALAMEIDFSIPAIKVIEKLSQLIELHGKPKVIRSDNGPEFISHQLLDWCHRQRIQMQFIQPGKPNQNCLVERFNKTYREEILDAYVFYSLEEVRSLTENFMYEYNHKRPHDSLNNLPPVLYVLKYGKHEHIKTSSDMFTTFQHSDGDDENINDDLNQKTNFEAAL